MPERQTAHNFRVRRSHDQALYGRDGEWHGPQDVEAALVVAMESEARSIIKEQAALYSTGCALERTMDPPTPAADISRPRAPENLEQAVGMLDAARQDAVQLRESAEARAAEIAAEAQARAASLVDEAAAARDAALRQAEEIVANARAVAAQAECPACQYVPASGEDPVEHLAARLEQGPHADKSAEQKEAPPAGESKEAKPKADKRPPGAKAKE